MGKDNCMLQPCINALTKIAGAIPLDESHLLR